MEASSPTYPTPPEVSLKNPFIMSPYQHLTNVQEYYSKRGCGTYQCKASAWKLLKYSVGQEISRGSASSTHGLFGFHETEPCDISQAGLELMNLLSIFLSYGTRDVSNF